jgi:Flp pilus assembly protein TadD
MNKRMGGLFACLLAGCVSTPKTNYDDAMAKLEADGNAADRLELPAHEKARASLAAAQLLDQNGKTEQAIALYERARANNSDHAHVCRRLAVLYDQVGELAKASVEYEKALAMFPGDAALLNDAGYNQFLRGNWTFAEDYLRQSIELKPENKRAWTNLGLTLVMRGRLSEAFEAFTHSVSDAQAHCHIAYAFMLQHRQDDAIHEYREALRLDPDLQLAQLALSKLESPKAPVTQQAAHTEQRPALPEPPEPAVPDDDQPPFVIGPK